MLLNQNRTQKKFQLAHLMMLVDPQTLKRAFFRSVEVMQVVIGGGLVKPDGRISGRIKRQDMIGQSNQFVPTLVVLCQACQAKIWTDEFIVGLCGPLPGLTGSSRISHLHGCKAQFKPCNGESRKFFDGLLKFILCLLPVFSLSVLEAFFVGRSRTTGRHGGSRAQRKSFSMGEPANSKYAQVTALV